MTPLLLLVTCNLCEQAKPRDEMAVVSRRRNTCKACHGAPKTCSDCGDVKEAEAFHFTNKAKSVARGLPISRGIVCKACYRAKYEASKRADPALFLFRRVKYRARAEGTEFAIAVADIFIPTHCPVLGLELAPVGQDGQAPNAPTLDRLDSSKGYLPGNVAVVSRLANVLKGGATAAEHERIAAWMRSHGVR